MRGCRSDLSNFLHGLRYSSEILLIYLIFEPLNTTMELHNNAMKLRRNDDLIASEVGDDLVMMSIQDGKYFAMNKTGSFIWSLLETQMSYDDLHINPTILQ